MFRTSMTDQIWNRLEPILVEGGVKRIRNLRLRIEGVLWRLRTGAPWRDLPTELGSWSREVDLEWSFIDSSYVKVHQHATGAAGTTKEEEAIGKSRGGNTSKIHSRCDAHGNPVQFLLTA